MEGLTPKYMALRAQNKVSSTPLFFSSTTFRPWEWMHIETAAGPQSELLPLGSWLNWLMNTEPGSLPPDQTVPLPPEVAGGVVVEPLLLLLLLELLELPPGVGGVEGIEGSWPGHLM